MGHPIEPAAAFVDRAESAAHRATLGALFTREFRTDTVGLWLAFFACLLAVYLGFSWVPSLLAGAGFSTSQASTGITVFNLGGVVGALAGGVCITRFGSRAPMLAGAALAAGSALVLSTLTLRPSADLPIMIMLAATGALINGVQTTMYALAAHVYPAVMRATGVGTAVAIGRSGAVLSGYVGAWALEFRGSVSFFGAMATAMVACWIGLAIVRRHIPGARHAERGTQN
jgi:AAHS family 4-hydroxybenzoate transporter-like MFS transporter